MTDGGAVEIDSFEEIPGPEEPLSVLVPVIEGAGEGRPSQVEIGSDVSLTRSLVVELGEDLGLGEHDVRERLAHTFGTTPDELPNETVIEGVEAQRDDVWRAALSERYELPSSLVRGRDMWQVTEIGEVAEGAARVSFGRRGHRELEMTLAGEAVADLKNGDPVVGTEILWRGRGGALGLGRATVGFVPDPAPPKPVPIWVPVMRLHRPHKEGCVATYTSESESSTKVNMTVKILGVGAEGGFKVGVNLLDEYVARSACVETVIPAKLQLLPGKTVVNGTEVAYGIHAKVVDIDPDKAKPRVVPKAEDDCDRSGDQLDGLTVKPYDQREIPSTDTRSVAIGVETETYGRMSVGLEMAGGIPVNLGMDYERSTQQKTTLRIDLSGGTSYLAYAPLRRAGAKLEQQMEICWTTNA